MNFSRYIYTRAARIYYENCTVCDINNRELHYYYYYYYYYFHYFRLSFSWPIFSDQFMLGGSPESLP